MKKKVLIPVLFSAMALPMVLHQNPIQVKGEFIGEYSKKAEENAALSEAYIKMMLARGEAEENITLAKKRLAWADSIDAKNTFPMAYTSAKENLDNAESSLSAFKKGDILFKYK